jgi:hypothetical protein
MNGDFEIGDVCIWQNCVGEWAYLNGIETTVIADKRPSRDLVSGSSGWSYPTDTPHPHKPGETLFGDSRELRKKHPPTTGELMIRAMFDALPQPVLEVA